MCDLWLLCRRICTCIPQEWFYTSHVSELLALHRNKTKFTAVAHVSVSGIASRSTFFGNMGSILHRGVLHVSSLSFCYRALFLTTYLVCIACIQALHFGEAHMRESECASAKMAEDFSFTTGLRRLSWLASSMYQMCLNVILNVKLQT